jgi:DNA-directed RNA polymerase subunit RPC12/RpoP
MFGDYYCVYCQDDVMVDEMDLSCSQCGSRIGDKGNIDRYSELDSLSYAVYLESIDGLGD